MNDDEEEAMDLHNNIGSFEVYFAEEDNDDDAVDWLIDVDGDSADEDNDGNNEEADDIDEENED